MFSVSFDALAVLENARVISNTKMTVLDGQIFLGSSELAVIITAHYFNGNDIVILDVAAIASFSMYDSGLCLPTPARTLPITEVYSQELTPIDYHAFGAIVSIIPLGSPEDFDLQHHTFVNVCCVATNIDKKNSTFEIHVEQYLSATKTTDDVFPIRCVFPATARWEKYKPIPAKGITVSIEGRLTGVERNDDRAVKHFIVDLEKVTFVVNNGTPARLKFTGFFGSQGSDSEKGAPPSKKRKTTNDRAVAESVPQDKGEGPSSGCHSKHN
ncbi:hypothetical protein B0H14DRAFT_3697888 [Mycena olivaceomarginata]|nr:hypothetical protein B0H14DRAFT_3697888 [Mycena olivaceomarginata]